MWIFWFVVSLIEAVLLAVAFAGHITPTHLKAMREEAVKKLREEKDAEIAELHKLLTHVHAYVDAGNRSGERAAEWFLTCTTYIRVKLSWIEQKFHSEKNPSSDPRIPDAPKPPVQIGVAPPFPPNVK